MIAGIDRRVRVDLGAREEIGGVDRGAEVIVDRGRHYHARGEIARREMVEVEGRGV